MSSKAPSATETPALSAGEPAVQLVAVSKSYAEAGQRHVLFEGLDWSIPRGARVALLGQSGSGKSTLLALMGALERPDSGAVYLAGQRIDTLGESERARLRRRHIGFVFQAFNLVPTLTLIENLLLPLDLDGRADRQAEARAAELLAAVGLGSRSKSYPDRLSGGEQQRVAVARALVGAPALVLADEPTGNLDQDSGERVLALFQALAAERGVTLVLATHSARAAASAQLRVSLERGRLVPVQDAGAQALGLRESR
jgi:putative ABC transport system ATP-binding protein